MVALVLVLLQRSAGWRRTPLGILAPYHAVAGTGRAGVSGNGAGRSTAYLFGDILAIGPIDLYWIWGGALLALGALARAVAAAAGDHRARGTGAGGGRAGLSRPAGVHAAGLPSSSPWR